MPWISNSTLGLAPDGRWQCGAFRHSVWLFFGPGRTGPFDMTTNTVAGRAVGALECEHLWESCVQGCDDPACEESCDLALDDCEATFPAGELICTDSLADADEPCLVHDTWTGVHLAGYATASTNNHLVRVGGMGPFDLLNRAHTAEVVDPPFISLWTASGVTLPEGRHLSDSIQEAGRIFIVGGEIDGDNPGVTSTVWMVY